MKPDRAFDLSLADGGTSREKQLPLQVKTNNIALFCTQPATDGLLSIKNAVGKSDSL